MMQKFFPSRSAHYSIKGYLYQFLKAIEELLSNGKVTIEGCEDIDVYTSSGFKLVQCKYHEAKSFNSSLIYKPVGLMVKHYLENPTELIRYRLYAHFGKTQQLLEKKEWISVEFLERALSKAKPQISAEKKKLIEFLEYFEFIPGLSFDSLEEKIKSLLAKEFSWSLEDVNNYYHNNAIAFIANIAIQKDITDRTVTKKQFKSSIDKKDYLFDSWQKKRHGTKNYIHNIRTRLKSEKALTNIKKRFLLISQELLNPVLSGIKITNFLCNLIEQYPLKGALYNTQPWTIIMDQPKDHLRELKANLIKNGIYYNDGYEEIFFCKKYFDEMPIIYTDKTNKITKASYFIKIISKNTFVEKLENTNLINSTPHIFIHASTTYPSNQYYLNNDNVTVYNLSALDNLTQLTEILN
jgi:hypothetical protein